MRQFQIVSIGAFVVSSMAGVAFGQCSESAEKSSAHVINASYRSTADTKDIVDTAVEAGSFKTLAAALKAAGLIDALKGKGPFTVFAPTDAAFAKLPAGTVENLLKPENKALLTSILTFHVVSGNVTADKVVKLSSADTLNGQRVGIAVKDGKVSLEGQSTVTSTDVKASNGVIHVIDTVLMPATKNIIATAAEASSFTTLLAAVDAAGLKAALEGDGPFTVFAPSDAAFAKLPAGTVESLLKPENKDQLISILKFHVVSGRVFADQVVKMKDSSKTLQGSTFSIKVKDGKVTIGNSKAMAGVVSTDIESSNGVIHVIDTVLMPN